MISFKYYLIILLAVLISNPTICQDQIENDALEKQLSKMYLKGFNFLQQAKYDSARYYLTETLKLHEIRYGKYDENTIGNYINLAIVHNILYDSQTAINYYNIAEKRLKEVDPNSEILPIVYNNKGNIFFYQYDYAEANKYYKYALQQTEMYGDTLDLSYTMYYSNYIRSLEYVGTLKTNRENVIKKLIELKKNIEDYDIRTKGNHIRTIVSLASTFQVLDLHENAIELLDLASRLNNLEETNNLHLESNIYYEKASLYIKEERYNEALKLLHWIIAQDLETNEISLNRVIFTHLRIAQTHYLMNNYLEAYDWIDHALNDIKDELLSSIDSTNIKSAMTTRLDFMAMNQLKASASLKIYEIYNDEAYLHRSYSTFYELINNIRSARMNMKNEKSIHIQSGSSIQVMYEAVKVAIELYNITNEIQYLEEAFEFNETYKAASLSTEIESIEAIRFANLPDKYVALEDSLNESIESYEHMRYELSFNKNASGIDLTGIDSIIFNLKDDYNDLLEEIEVNFPNYFSLKYNSNFTTLEEIQSKLHHKQALAEYVLADSILTIFVVDNQQKRVVTRKIDSSFADDCIRYYRLLQSQEFDKGVHQTYYDYVSLSRKFYKTLVEPVREITGKKEIIFVPDGELMYLPFETFLTRDVDNQYINYMDLPYLIHELSVGYSYSATLLFNERIKKEAPEDRVLAFAPAYENLLNESEPLVWNRQSNPDFLIPLEGAREEVKNLAGFLPSRVFMDMDATESNFKKYASNYSVLHLAMHTIMNDEEPMFSRLAFSRLENDTTEDHDLFTYEIYNLDLNAEMVVLSSCSSGYGKMQKGEGMMSMARGFMYAGCPTIVMTLWQVSDQSSAELMSSFYKYLKRGKTKNEALRLAKIDYINSSDKLKSNPYFWSSFLVVGDSSPLYSKKPIFYWALVTGSFIMIVLIVANRKRIRKAIRRS